jgi:hypothetical protein
MGGVLLKIEQSLSLQQVNLEFPESWWQWIVFAFVGILGIFLVRLTITLDLNSLLRDRRQKRIAQLQNACTHLLIENLGEGKLRVTDCFYSPPGTLLVKCSRCQLTSYDPQRDYPGRADFFTSNIDTYLQSEKEFSRLLKKFGYTT